MEIRLPPNKLQQILLLLHQWRQHKHCSKRELLSLIGKLVHACKVVRVSRIFLRQMIDTAHSVRHLHYQIRLNRPGVVSVIFGTMEWQEHDGSP